MVANPDLLIVYLLTISIVIYKAKENLLTFMILLMKDGKKFQININLHLESTAFFMFQNKCLLFIITILVACSCSCYREESNRFYLKIFYHSCIIPEQWREQHIFISIREDNFSYEISEINYPREYCSYDRKEIGIWTSIGSDTLAFYPKWEILFNKDSIPIIRDLSIIENRTAFNQTKHLLLYNEYTLKGVQKDEEIVDLDSERVESYSENDFFKLIETVRLHH